MSGGAQVERDEMIARNRARAAELRHRVSKGRASYPHSKPPLPPKPYGQAIWERVVDGMSELIKGPVGRGRRVRSWLDRNDAMKAAVDEVLLAIEREDNFDRLVRTDLRGDARNVWILALCAVAEAKTEEHRSVWADALYRRAHLMDPSCRFARVGLRRVSSRMWSPPPPSTWRPVPGDVPVSGYRRSDGTPVAAYRRSKPRRKRR
jgi:hypothetical protein